MPREKSLSNSLADLQEKFCFALIKRRFDKVVVVNHAVAKRLRELGFRGQQILESSNFVTVTPPTVLRPYNARDTTIIFCGRLVQQKGVNDFLKVCEFLQQYIPDFRAVMIGVGPEMERLQEVIAHKNLTVELTGFLSETEKFKYLEHAKLFVFPSIEEGWGIAIAEALAVGTPVLAYDLSVYREVFGTVLHHVPISKIDDLTQTCLRILQGYQQKPAMFIHDQQRAIACAQNFIRDTVATNEYTFLTE
jgi:glycosyltransferase involved in cell wall biosynthesis